MRWIDQETEFKSIFLEARTCVYIDSGRQRTTLQKLTFDDAQTCTPAFAEMLKELMNRAGDEACYYAVLDPDPVHYFHRHFRKYPVVEITRLDTPDDYLNILNENPGGSPVDAIGVNAWAWVIVPHSIKWFVHALRDDDDGGGHLWIPENWIEGTSTLFPFVRDERRDDFRGQGT